MRIIRILVLTTSFPLYQKSVSGIFVKRLVENLPNSVKPTVLTPCGRLKINNHENNYKVRCFKYAPKNMQVLAHEPGGIPVALNSKKFSIILLPIFILSMFINCLMEARKVDLIHANWSMCGFISGIVGILTNKPVVTTLRGEDFNKFKSSYLHKTILNICVFTNKKIITVSEAIYGSILSTYPKYKEKFQFIPNGVEFNFIESGNAKVKSYSTDKYINILTIGSLIKRKDIKTIIEAVAIANKENDKYKLHIIGDGCLLEPLKQLANKMNLSDRVIFYGNLPPDTLSKYFLASDLFVLASLSEGRPNVILEAFASGVPVVASNIDGIKELVTHNENGLLFSPGDKFQLAQQLNVLAKDKEIMSKLTSNARRFIMDNNLLWPNTGEKYADVFRQLTISQN